MIIKDKLIEKPREERLDEEGMMHYIGKLCDKEHVTCGGSC